MSNIHFATKEENNARREKEFLALAPTDRFSLFLKLCGQMSAFTQSQPKEDKGNFVIDRLRDGV